jgi:hypothetical protein
VTNHVTSLVTASSKRNRRVLKRMMGYLTYLRTLTPAHMAEYLRQAHEQSAAEPVLRSGDTMRRVMAREGFSAPEIRAAGEIEKLFRLITGGLTPKSGLNFDVGGMRDGHDLPIELIDAYQCRYRPWRDQAGRVGIHGSTTEADLVLRVLIDNQTLGNIETDFGFRHGRASAILRRSLQRYAAIAGWMTLDIGETKS